MDLPARISLEENRLLLFQLLFGRFMSTLGTYQSHLAAARLRYRRMNWPRRVGLFLVTAGCALLSIYLVPTVYGAAMSRIAIARFRAQSSADGLWNSARVRAYQRTLDLSFPQPEAILRVPKVGIEVPVLEGTSSLILNRGAGHIPGTALPGESGNVAITGHRDGFFRALKDVLPGDVIDMERASRPQEQGYPGQQVDHYVVQKIKIVSPSDISVLNQTTDSTITLVTCYPFYYVGAAPERYIVQASLVPATHGKASTVQN
jgi:sortase A